MSIEMESFEPELRGLNFPIITAALDAGWEPTEDGMWEGYIDYMKGGGYHSEDLAPIIEKAVSGASKLDLMKGYVESKAEAWLDEYIEDKAEELLDEYVEGKTK